MPLSFRGFRATAPDAQPRGQYGTSIPSKFISADGLTLYLQSNVCCGGDAYTFSLRKVYLQTYAFVPPTNSLSAANLALAPGTEAISKSAHFGTPCGLSCSDQMNGIPGASEDDFDEQAKTSDLWGYVWPQSYNVNRVVYETGSMFPDGGWFASDLRVQVRQNFQWIDVAGVTISPVYRYSNAAGAHAIYALILWDAWGDGVRIIGTPGGTSHFTTIGQLGVYYGLASIPPQNLKAYSPEKR